MQIKLTPTKRGHGMIQYQGERISTKKQRSIIKQQAIDTGLITDIKVTKVEGMRYGFADFESAGVVKETQYLPENM